MKKKTIDPTLRSIFAASARTAENFPLQVIVVADGCSDATESVAEAAGARVISSIVSKGKWSALKTALSYVSPDVTWVAFVDSGSLWPADLLTEFRGELLNEDIVAIAPGYHSLHAGFAEKIAWRVEALLKCIENTSGGPISAHGATIFYRREVLLRAFEWLGPHTYINDDIAIPLAVRCLEPRKSLKYRSDVIVYDLGSSSCKMRERFRRIRMMSGNLQ